MIAIIKLSQKLKPILIKIGIDRKSIKDGITIQKILVDKFFIFSISLESIYSHIIDRTEIRGMEATSPPIKLLFFDISETRVIIPEEISIFKKIYFIFYISIKIF